MLLRRPAVNAPAGHALTGPAVQPGDGLQLVLFLPSFDFAVLYSQPSMQLAQAPRVGVRGGARGGHPEAFQDPEVEQALSGHEPNPCEYKALKLSQALATTGSDRCFPCWCV